MMAVKLLVKIAVMMMAPVALRCHRKRGGESPPPSSSSLTSSLDGRMVSLWSMASMAREGREPLGYWICLSLFLRSQILPFRRFLYSRRSVTPIGLNFGHDLYQDISFLAAKEGHQPPYGVATKPPGRALGRGAPPGLVLR